MKLPLQLWQLACLGGAAVQAATAALKTKSNRFRRFWCPFLEPWFGFISLL